ncbi:MAG: hypothetical protein ACYDBB_17710 [Armatimonadota bacterium]
MSRQLTTTLTGWDDRTAYLMCIIAGLTVQTMIEQDITISSRTAPPTIRIDLDDVLKLIRGGKTFRTTPERNSARLWVYEQLLQLSRLILHWPRTQRSQFDQHAPAPSADHGESLFQLLPALTYYDLTQLNGHDLQIPQQVFLSVGPDLSLFAHQNRLRSCITVHPRIFGGYPDTFAGRLARVIGWNFSQHLIRQSRLKTKKFSIQRRTLLTTPLSGQGIVDDLRRSDHPERIVAVWNQAIMLLIQRGWIVNVTETQHLPIALYTEQWLYQETTLSPGAALCQQDPLFAEVLENPDGTTPR